MSETTASQPSIEPNAETNILEPHRAILEQLLPIIASDPIMIAAEKKNEIKGKIGDVSYWVHVPLARRAESAHLFLVDLVYPDGQRFDVVVRDQPAIAEQFATHIAHHPTIKRHVPQVYGVVHDWVVMQRLHGLELAALTWRLLDPEFRAAYVTQVLQTIRDTAKQGLVLDDVGFNYAHNVMVDPYSAELKLIELDNLKPHPYYNTQELITKQLFSECEHSLELNRPREQEQEFVFELIQAAFAVLPPSELYLRHRAIAPTHQDYPDAYFLKYSRVPDPETTEIIGFFEDPTAERFSDSMLDAVARQDFDLFKTLLRTYKHRQPVTDPDPKYAPILLPDNQS